MAKAKDGPRAIAGQSNRNVTSSRIALNIFFALVSIFQFLPLLWVLMNSLKGKMPFLQSSVSIPSEWMFENYVTAWNKGIATYYVNSIFVAVVTIFLVLLFSSMAAYGLTRFKFRGRNALFMLILGGLMMSPQVVLVPLYKLMNSLGLYDTLWSLILAYTAFGLPFSVFLLRSYFISFPRELEEAAYIDGYGTFGLFFRIVLPISRPVLGAAAIVRMLNVWNEFTFALVLLNSQRNMTIPIGLENFRGQHTTEVTIMLAGVVLGAIPMVFVYLVSQKQFIRGLTAGATKG